jgi:hypothetical protein
LGKEGLTDAGAARFSQHHGSTRAAPYAILAAGAAVVLVLEFFRGTPPLHTSLVWPILEAAVAGAALFAAWRHQRELNVIPLAVFALIFQLAWVGLHLVRGVPSDYDSQVTYANEGNALLHGRYPHSEYPPGAVLLFAFESLLGGGHTRVSHAFVMVPFQLLFVLALWSLGTPWSGWFATVAAFWPADAFIAEFKLDVVPAGLLVFGIACALRDRWVLAGVVLGLGTAVKWTPAVAVAVLTLWLLTTARGSLGMRLLASASISFLVVNFPFLVWSPRAVLHAYAFQSGRQITGESAAFVPLRALGLAHVADPWKEAVVPGWANPAVVTVQAFALVCIFAAVVATRQNACAALSLAAVAPVVFLLLNRVFSPQFLILLIAGWFVGGSLLARTRLDQVGLAALVLCASLANTLVYPTLPRAWVVFSGVLFGFALAASGWVLLRAGAFPDLRGLRARIVPPPPSGLAGEAGRLFRRWGRHDLRNE